MGFSEWLNRNVIDLNTLNSIRYGDVPNVVKRTGKRINKATFSQLVKTAFNQTYMSDEEKKPAQGNTQATIATFFGLPSGDLNPRHVFKTMLGMSGGNETYSPSKNLLKGLLLLPLVLVGIVLQTVLNVIKLVTQFLPLAIKHLLNKAIFELSNMDTGNFVSPFNQASDLKASDPQPISHRDNLNYVGKSFFKVIGLTILGILYAAAKLVHLIGRAITAPALSAKVAYDSGIELGGENVLGKFFGIVAATLSVAVTAVIYTILFPLGIKLLATQVLPAILSTSAMTWLTGAVATITPVLSAISSALAPVIAAIGSVLGTLGITTSSGILAAATAGTMTIVAGTVLAATVDGIGRAIDPQSPPEELLTQQALEPNSKKANLYINTNIPGSTLYPAAYQRVLATAPPTVPPPPVPVPVHGTPAGIPLIGLNGGGGAPTLIPIST